TNITRECAGPAGTPVTFTPAVTDACDPNVAVICTPASGSLFARGTTNVTCVATDANTNSSQCTFTVTIQDTTPPQITCPSNIIAAEEPRDSGSATVSFSDATATDICDGSAAATCVPPSGSSFLVGTNTVVCTTADGTGNTNS